MRLQAELDLAFLFISHDIAVVRRVSHRIAVMSLGEIVEIGSRSDHRESVSSLHQKADGGRPVA
jgi:ABC-type glutathione transport system ATPase component